MDRRRAPIVAILESRMSRELARLVDRHGGNPISVPAVESRAELTPDVTRRLVDDLLAGRHDFVVFMTGVSVSLLFQSADDLGIRPSLVAALSGVTTVCRGPKPTAALRGFGVTPTIAAASPFTSAEVLDALGEIDIRGRSVLLFHYGERSATVAETIRARGADLSELWVYRWLMPEDTRALEDLAARIIAGEIDALAVTCQIQFKHLLRVVPEPAARRWLLRVLDEQVVVAAVGPTCEAILRAHDVRVEVMPEHPKMGPLVLALMQHLERARSDGANGGPDDTRLPN